MMGQICHHFSWTLDYLLEYPDWFVVQRMLIDAPRYETDEEKKEKKKSKTFTLTEQSSEDLLKMFNS